MAGSVAESLLTAESWVAQTRAALWGAQNNDKAGGRTCCVYWRSSILHHPGGSAVAVPEQDGQGRAGAQAADTLWHDGARRHHRAPGARDRGARCPSLSLGPERASTPGTPVHGS